MLLKEILKARTIVTIADATCEVSPKALRKQDETPEKELKWAVNEARVSIPGIQKECDFERVTWSK